MRKPFFGRPKVVVFHCLVLLGGCVLGGVPGCLPVGDLTGPLEGPTATQESPGSLQFSETSAAQASRPAPDPSRSNGKGSADIDRPGDRGKAKSGGVIASKPTLDGPVLSVDVTPPKKCGIAPPAPLPDEPFTPPCGVGTVEELLTDGAKRSKPSHKPWRAGSTIAEHKGVLYVADHDNKQLVAVDSMKLTVLGKLDVSGRPGQLVVGPNGTLFATIESGHEVIRVAPGKPFGKVTTWTLGAGPYGLALLADSQRLFVALHGARKLLVIDATSGAVLHTAATGHLPRGVAVNGKGRAVVAHTTGLIRVYAFDANSLTQLGKTYQEGSPGELIHCNADGAHPKRTHADSVAVDPETGHFAVAHQIARTGNPGWAEALASLPDGGNEFGMKSSKTGQLIGPPPYYGGVQQVVMGTIFVCRPLQPAVSRVDSVGAFHIQGSFINKHMREWAAALQQPSAIAFSPTHRLAFVAAAGADRVIVLQRGKVGYKSVDQKAIGQLHTGAEPVGIAVSPDGRHVWTHNAHDPSVSHFDLALLARRVSGKEPKHVCAKLQGRINTPPYSPEATAGRRLFTHAGNKDLSFQGDLTCGGCHPRGGDDGLRWVGKTGLRQTQALAGRLEGTAPFNWGGTGPTLLHNMQLTVNRMGGGGLCFEELQWLKAFLDEGLHAPVNPNRAPGAKLTAEQAKGKAIFESKQAACASCHVPGTWTDGQRHNVGTASKMDVAIAYKLAKLRLEQLKETDPKTLYDVDAMAADILKYDTPSLTGLWHTAPYLHDGSAATLEEVLKRTATTMGHTASLNDAQRKALIAYLLTL